jgi:hypothetical protein
MSTQILNNVPADQVGTVTQSFVNDGAVRVVAEKNGGGTFDITATFDD